MDRVQFRRDTAENWQKFNPVLMEGEMGLVTDNPNQYKMGDGTNNWNDLPLRGYDGNISQELGNDENALVSQRKITEEINNINSNIDILGQKTDFNYKLLDTTYSENTSIYNTDLLSGDFLIGLNYKFTISNVGENRQTQNLLVYYKDSSHDIIFQELLEIGESKSVEFTFLKEVNYLRFTGSYTSQFNLKIYCKDSAGYLFSKNAIIYSLLKSFPDNTNIIIDEDIDLSGENITLNNVRLIFNENFKIVNGTISGTYYIDANDDSYIFDETLNLDGNCKNHHLSIKWFGANGSAIYKKSEFNDDGTYIEGSGDITNETDNTNIINHCIAQANKSGVNRVYIPKGCYGVRFQYTESQLADYNATGLTNNKRTAIQLLDYTELYGDGENSKITVIFSNSYRTGVTIGNAQLSDEELQELGLSPSTYILFNDTRYIQRIGCKVHDLYIDTGSDKYRNSVEDEKNKSIQTMGVDFYSIGNEVLKNAVGGNFEPANVEVYNLHIYDVSLGIRFSSNGTYKSEIYNNSKAYNNYIEKCTNKAFEIHWLKYCNIFNNYVEKAEDCFQFINAYYCKCYNNTFKGNRGIHITFDSSFNIITGNHVYSNKEGLIFRIDASPSSGNLYNQGNTIFGNEIHANEDDDNSNYIMGFYGHATNSQTIYTIYQNNKIANNILYGKRLLLGYNEDSDYSGAQPIQINGLIFENNIVYANQINVGVYAPLNTSENKSTMSNCTIRGNKLLHNGFLLRGTCDGLIIENNELINVDSTSFIQIDDICSTKSVIVKNNTFIQNTGGGFIVMSNEAETNETGGGFEEISNNFIRCNVTRCIELRNLDETIIPYIHNNNMRTNNEYAIRSINLKSIIKNNIANAIIYATDETYVSDNIELS